MSFDNTAPPQGLHANCRLFTPGLPGSTPPPVTVFVTTGLYAARWVVSFKWLLPTRPAAPAHLVVHLQRVALPSGLEVLRVGVHREVDLPVEALHVDRVPVFVVQQAAHGHGHAAAAEPRPAVVCGEGK